MANTAVFSASIQYTPPAAPANSGLPSFSLQASYNAQQVGQIDVPSGTAPATVFNVAFGYVNKAKLLVIKNLMSTDVAVRLNGSTDPNFCLPPGGMITYSAAVDPSTYPLVSASVTVLTAPAATEYIQTFVFGD
jgi:hypothetical protein